jgi:ankyrin repeat protein
LFHKTSSFTHNFSKDRHLSDRQNRTPLMLAAAAEHRDIVRVLGDEAALCRIRNGCGGGRTVAGLEGPQVLEMVV